MKKIIFILMVTCFCSCTGGHIKFDTAATTEKGWGWFAKDLGKDKYQFSFKYGTNTFWSVPDECEHHRCSLTPRRWLFERACINLKEKGYKWFGVETEWDSLITGWDITNINTITVKAFKEKPKEFDLAWNHDLGYSGNMVDIDRFLNQEAKDWIFNGIEPLSYPRYKQYFFDDKTGMFLQDNSESHSFTNKGASYFLIFGDVRIVGINKSDTRLSNISIRVPSGPHKFRFRKYILSMDQETSDIPLLIDVIPGQRYFVDSTVGKIERSNFFKKGNAEVSFFVTTKPLGFSE